MDFLFSLASRFGAVPSCDPNLHGGGLLGLPHWYKYLNGVQTAYGCTPQLRALSDVWLVAAAIIEILLRVAAIAAIVFVMVGGIQFINSHGDPGATKKARETAVNALIGLVISIAAAGVVTFVAGRFK